MTDLEDPSRQRDALAALTATQRSDAAATSATDRYADIVAHVAQLSSDVKTVQDGLVANTACTRETADKARNISDAQSQMALTQAVIANSIAHIKADIAKINVDDLAEATQVLTSMKGGFVVLGWIGQAAKWIASIAAAIGILWAATHWTPPR